MIHLDRALLYLASWGWKLRGQEMLWACGYKPNGNYVKVSLVIPPTHKDAPQLRREFSDFTKELRTDKNDNE
jgi:hypothetical protein